MTTPAHKQTDPAKKPGQIINPINTDLMDDMGQYAQPRGTVVGNSGYLTRRGNPVPDIEPAKRVTWGPVKNDRDVVLMLLDSMILAYDVSSIPVQKTELTTLRTLIQRL